jgi:hypothetical protein
MSRDNRTALERYAQSVIGSPQEDAALAELAAASPVPPSAHEHECAQDGFGSMNTCVDRGYHECSCGAKRNFGSNDWVPSAVQEEAPSGCPKCADIEEGRCYDCEMKVQRERMYGSPAAAPVEGAIPTEPTPELDDPDFWRKESVIWLRATQEARAENARLREALHKTETESGLEALRLTNENARLESEVARLTRERDERAPISLGEYKRVLDEQTELRGNLIAENARLLNELTEAGKREKIATDAWYQAIADTTVARRELAGYREVEEQAKRLLADANPLPPTEGTTATVFDSFYSVTGSRLARLRRALASLSPTPGEPKDG